MTGCKHNGSTISIALENGVVEMIITGGGTTLAADSCLQPGHGLTHTREYVELLEGRLTARNRPDVGFEVRAECHL